MKRHPSEQAVGRIRRDGGWDRRYRRSQVIEWPEPVEYEEPEPEPFYKILGFGLFAVIGIYAAFVVGMVLWVGA